MSQKKPAVNLLNGNPCLLAVDCSSPTDFANGLLHSRFDNCRLAANRPIEDRHSEGYCNATDGYLFGVFDGHGGVANAQAVSERLFNYIAVNLLNTSLLEKFCKRVNKGSEPLELVKFLTHSDTYFSKVRQLLISSHYLVTLSYQVEHHQ